MSDLCNLTVIQNPPLFDRPVLQVTLTLELAAIILRNVGLLPLAIGRGLRIHIPHVLPRRDASELGDMVLLVFRYLSAELAVGWGVIDNRQPAPREYAFPGDIPLVVRRILGDDDATRSRVDRPRRHCSAVGDLNLPWLV